LSNFTTITGFPAPPARPENGDWVPAVVAEGLGLGVSLGSGVPEALDALLEPEGCGVATSDPPEHALSASADTATVAMIATARVR
jgi:hypothetical protein